MLSDRFLLRIQSISGLTFLVFVLFHMANTMVAIGGPEVYDEFQRAGRSVYQWLPVELGLLLLPLIVHGAAAGVRIARSGFRRPGQTARARLHRYTGYFLLAVVFGHVAAVRGTSFFYDVYPGFAGVAFSLWWLPWLFYPYYLAFSFAALYHGLNGLGLALSGLGAPLPAGLRAGPGFWAPIALGTAAVGVALLTFGGALGPIPDPTDNDYARLYERLFGVLLER